MSEPRCPYCGNASRLCDSSAVYGGRSYGPIYLCAPCDAYVGCHPGTTEPLGRLANKELREWKKRAHAAFDPLWQRKLAIRRRQRGQYPKARARGSGYRWLAEQLNIPREDCHIGMFDVEQCKKVIEVCTNWRAQPK